MKILAVSTAEQCSSIAVTDGDNLLYEENRNAGTTHSKKIMQMVEHALEGGTGLSLGDIDAFVAARGPGSFTGVRIGISMIEGLAFASGKKAFGVSSLDGIAYNFSYLHIPVCVMMDAKRNEVYCAVYRFKDGTLITKTSEYVISPDQAMSLVEEPAFFAGSGTKAYRSLIEKHTEDFSISTGDLDPPTAMGIVKSALSQPGFFNDPGNILAPVYIRKSDAEMQFADKQQG